MTFRIAVGPQGSARPAEALTALFGEDVAGGRIWRGCGLGRRRGRDPLRCGASLRRRAGAPRRRRGRGRGPVIETEGLSKRFGDTVAVSELNLRVEAGEVMGFLGPNGSGKTTTIRLLMGLLRPSAGRAAILGRDCHSDAVALKRDVGYLPDEPFLYPYLSGTETLELVGGPARLRARRGAAAAPPRSPSGSGSREAARAYTVTYSLGMKKRLALALALIHDPRVLILDEPTNGLDPAGARQMRATITELAAGGRTIFLSTHLLDAAERLCHRVAIIQRGKLQAVGTPDELRARYEAPGTTLEDLFLRVTTDVTDAATAGDGDASAPTGGRARARAPPTRSTCSGWRRSSSASACGRCATRSGRARRGRTTLFATVVGVATALAYVGLFAQAFAVIAHTVGLAGPARGAGAGDRHDRVRQPGGARRQQRGRPRRIARERIPARAAGVAAALVAARGLADAVTDPVGGLFLLPVLICGGRRLAAGPRRGWPMAIAISLLIADRDLDARVRGAAGGGPLRAGPARRRMIWTGLRLVAALSLATLWMLGTWVMRAPAALGDRRAALAPCVDVLAGDAGERAAGRAGARATAGARSALMLRWRVGRRPRCWWSSPSRGAPGWRAGRRPAPSGRRRRRAPPAGAAPADGGDQGSAPDRPRSLAVAGADRDAGDLHRRPDLRRRRLELDDGQPRRGSRASRIRSRSTWAPSARSRTCRPSGARSGSCARCRCRSARLLAAKARAWAIIVGGIAALVFAVCRCRCRTSSVATRLGAGLLVTAGAAGDELRRGGDGQRRRRSLRRDRAPRSVRRRSTRTCSWAGSSTWCWSRMRATRVAGLALYGFAGWTYWQAGVEQAGFCLDAEAVRARRVRAADGATMLIVYALGGRALRNAGKVSARRSCLTRLAISGLVVAGAGRRRRGDLPGAPPAAAVAASGRSRVAARRGGCLGALAGGRAAGDAAARIDPLPARGASRWSAALRSLAEEVVLRGVLQRALLESRLGAAAISFARWACVSRRSCRLVAVGSGSAALADRRPRRRPRGGARSSTRSPGASPRRGWRGRAVRRRALCRSVGLSFP